MNALKTLLTGLILSACLGSAHAVETLERPWGRHGTVTSVSLSTSAYTPIPSTTTTSLSNRTNLLIASPSANTAIQWGHIGNCTSTAVSVSTKGPIKVYQTATETSIPLGPGECLWMMSGAAAAESIIYQEESQVGGTP